MSGDFRLDDKQQWAMYFASILKSRGFHAAAESLEATYSPFSKEPKTKEDLTWSEILNKRE